MHGRTAVDSARDKPTNCRTFQEAASYEGTVPWGFSNSKCQAMEGKLPRSRDYDQSGVGVQVTLR